MWIPFLRKHPGGKLLTAEEAAALKATWEVPPGIQRGTEPRAVRLTGTAVSMHLLMVFLLGLNFVIGFSIFTSLAQEKRSYDLLMKSGERIDAKILSKSMDNRGKSKKFYVTYSLVVDGKTYQNRVGVPWRFCNQVQENQSVPAMYLPADPRQSRLVAQGGPASPWVAIAFLPVTLLLPWVLLVPVWRQRALLSTGRAAPGVIVKVRLFDHKGRRVDFEFEDEFGQPYKGSWVTERYQPLPPVGTLVHVLYNPENPKKSALYPMYLVALS